MTEALDLVVDRTILLDVRIGVRDVRLGLIVIEVRDEILDGVIRKEVAELGAQLGGERFVVAQDERRFLHELHDARHGDRLSGAGDAEQRLGFVATQNTLGELVGSRRLVAR